MNTRIIELCIANKIYTTDELVALVKIPKEEAMALISKDDTVKISELTISKCLKYFDCSYDYFFCLVE